MSSTTADEFFVTGTGAELVPVISLDGRVIGEGKPGPVTGRLLGSFRALRTVEGRDCSPEFRPQRNRSRSRDSFA